MFTPEYLTSLHQRMLMLDNLAYREFADLVAVLVGAREGSRLRRVGSQPIRERFFLAAHGSHPGRFECLRDRSRRVAECGVRCGVTGLACRIRARRA